MYFPNKKIDDDFDKMNNNEDENFNYVPYDEVSAD